MSNPSPLRIGYISLHCPRVSGRSPSSSGARPEPRWPWPPAKAGSPHKIVGRAWDFVNSTKSRASYESAGTGQGLGKTAAQNVHFPLHAKVGKLSPPFFAQNPQPMGIIQDGETVVLLGNFSKNRAMGRYAPPSNRSPRPPRLSEWRALHKTGFQPKLPGLLWLNLSSFAEDKAIPDQSEEWMFLSANTSPPAGQNHRWQICKPYSQRP